MDPFVSHGRLTRAAQAPGPLSGLSVAVKDLFDWAGVPTGAGNPDWLAGHPAPATDAAVLTALLAAGATLHGKTVTDELAYSIHGDNQFYGTPKNSAAPGRVPGGSSSGSAAAVAAGLVDAALGTDTGGSVRVPAAYCGLWGLRTTHGAVSRDGLTALARSFDTVGWFGRTAGPVAQVAQVLLAAQAPARPWARLLVWGEALALADHETQAHSESFAAASGLPVTDLAGLADDFGGLEGLRKTYVTIQAFEAWAEHGAWITAARPTFAPAIAARFAFAATVTGHQAAEARRVQSRFRAVVREALDEDGLLLLPATGGPAPRIGQDPGEVDRIREKTMRLTAPAGLAGLPQLTVPFAGADGLPRGLGLVGPAGSDRALVTWAAGRGAP